MSKKITKSIQQYLFPVHHKGLRDRAGYQKIFNSQVDINNSFCIFGEKN